MWTREESHKPLSHAWSAVMSGEMIGFEKEGKIEDIFLVSITLFLFDAATRKRLCLKTGESTIELVFQKQADGHGCWIVKCQLHSPNFFIEGSSRT
jgi:hypothetical protein